VVPSPRPHRGDRVAGGPAAPEALDNERGDLRLLGCDPREASSMRKARSAVMRAERIAPVSFSVNPLAHDALAAMMYRARRRAVPDDLRILARRVGIDVPV
jgi:hypothetical protein